MDPIIAFIDDTQNHETTPLLSSLTALLVPATHYDAIRCAIYRSVLGPRVGETSVLFAPELKFSNLLRDRPDPEKLALLSDLIDLAIEQKLRFVRMGYFITGELREMFSADPLLLGPSWLGIAGTILTNVKDCMVIPVMDAGFQESFQKTVNSLSSPGKYADMMRAAGLQKSVSLPSSERLCEVLYADSRYSALLQLTDAIAGLRRVADTARLRQKGPASVYKLQLLELSRRLDPLALCEQEIRLTIE